MALEAPATTEGRPRVRLAPLVGPGVLLALVYTTFGTWSVGQGFGGVDDDGGWTDFRGNPTSTPPPVVDVQGHPALWVYLVLVAILVATAFWARVDGVRSRRRAVIGVLVAAAFVVAVIAVFTVVQSRLVEDAMSRGDLHPPILGNVSVTVSRMTSG